jgi:uncharacterized protein (DUF4415 family)
MKPAATSPFTVDQINAAIAAAPDTPTYDPDNPPTTAENWADAIVSRSLAELKTKLAARKTRGAGKKPVKIQTAIRFDPDVLAALKATGRGWQTRVNNVMREWVAHHPA